MEENISVWEGEGGSLNEGFTQDLTGSVNQIEWAERIRAQVNGEFDRVAKALEAATHSESLRHWRLRLRRLSTCLQ